MEGVDEPIKVEVRLEAAKARDEQFVRKAVARAVVNATGWREEEVGEWRLVRRTLDARKKPVKAVWTVEVVRLGEELVPNIQAGKRMDRVEANAPVAVVVGTGPAGLFAALELLKEGIKPIVLERGAEVRERRRDLVEINRNHLVNPHSNYCFGEGGAGTYSDGKLYTRSHKRGNIQGVLEVLVAHGADPDILVEAHPHIGTNKLPGIIESMRETILQCGGEVRFKSYFKDVELDADGRVESVDYEELGTGKTKRLRAADVVLATGHSARDIFRWMHRRNWSIEAKPFAMGVRVEHSQEWVDKVQYHGEKQAGEADAILPPAAYRLVCQSDGRGVHSFCMCPGGIIAPCATNQEEVVMNGWSPSKRNNPFANSGIVVQLEPGDWESAGFDGPLGAMEYQAAVERSCWDAAGQSQAAPAQRLVDFIAGRKSETLPPSSYVPGIVSVNLRELLPDVISERITDGFIAFSKKMIGFNHRDALVVAPESRTSSPVRIPRDTATLMHPDVPGLFPCGEGAGYAGGILSAALDGIRVARAISARTS